MPDGVFENTLREIAAAAPAGSDDWWIIGSGALKLSRITKEPVRDIDILTTRKTALAFLAYWDIAATPAVPHPFFRSSPFVQVRRPRLLPIDLLGDMHLYENNCWTPLTLKTRNHIVFGSANVFIPELEEQLSVLRRFGRPKDLERAALVEAALN
ncbi:hypothetical protein [Hoeflea sp. TYP-13]|uniref:hypothetical protein n=1 Tax=Hoeflea sp. TYP-13 TaxID=3230023 RepID=UPI0034C6409B